MTLTFQSATSDTLLLKLDLNSLFWRIFPRGYQSVLGFDRAIGGKPVVQKVSSTEPVIGNKNVKLRRVEIRFKETSGVAILREASVTLSGKVPWEMLYRLTIRMVPEIKTLKFTVTNTAIRFNLKRVVRLEQIYKEYRSKPRSGPFTMEYEPEFFNRLLIRFQNGIVVFVFGNGTVVAQGRNLRGIEGQVRDILGGYKGAYGAEMKAEPVPLRKNLPKKRMNMIEARYERARSWTNTRSGYYVRPGPNKAPRFYALPKNPVLVRQKVIRAYANAGVQIPNKVRVILGIPVSAAVVAPKKMMKKTATLSWNSNAPTGMYVRPGPAGLPKLYKIPKLIPQGRKTVVAAYKKAGINIPQKVKAIFGIKNVSPAVVSASIKGNVTTRGVFRIDGLSCDRYKLSELQDIAKRLDIAYQRVPKKTLCAKIRASILKNKKKPSSSAANFVIDGKNHFILMNDRRIRRETKERALTSFKVSELKNFVKAIDPLENVNSLKTKKNLINTLIERKRTKNLLENMNMNFSPSSSSSSESESESEEEMSPPQLPLNTARKLLGNNFTNTELKEFLNRYLRLPSTSNGTVKRENLNKLVKEFQNRKRGVHRPRLLLNVRREVL